MRLAKGQRALVIGGSMSGLLAALALKQHGWQADVYERVAEPLAGRGAGIVAQPELKAILRRLGLAADGIRSTVRQQYLPDVAPRYAGYTAWRGLIAESAFPKALHAALFEDFAFCLPDNEQMLGYPVAGPDNDLRPANRRYNFVWYRPASEERELPRLLTDDSGRTHVLSIPPPLIARDVIATMRADAERVLAPQFNE